MGLILDPPIVSPEDPHGRYWSLSGLNTLMGPTNVAVESNLGNDTRDLVIEQVIADGTTADAYTDFRASRGSIIVPTPIASTSPNFAIVQLATNLYTAWLLVSHRIDWDTGESEVPDAQKPLVAKAKGLYSRAMELYRQLFGDVQHDAIGGFQSVDIERDTDARPYACWNW